MDIIAGYIRSSMYLNFVQVCSISPWHYNIFRIQSKFLFLFLVAFQHGAGGLMGYLRNNCGVSYSFGISEKIPFSVGVGHSELCNVVKFFCNLDQWLVSVAFYSLRKLISKLK